MKTGTEGTKLNAIEQLMELVAGDEVKQITTDVKVGWLKRDAFRRRLPAILLEDCPATGVEAEFTEKEDLFSSIFTLSIRGTVRNIHMFMRVFKVSVQLEMAQ